LTPERCYCTAKLLHTYKRRTWLNIDLVHRWMRANSIASAADARQVLQQLKSTPANVADQRKAA
jgi:hypothetical protein